jgi:hypothetical protein
MTCLQITVLEQKTIIKRHGDSTQHLDITFKKAVTSMPWQLSIPLEEFHELIRS